MHVIVLPMFLHAFCGYDTAWRLKNQQNIDVLFRKNKQRSSNHPPWNALTALVTWLGGYPMTFANTAHTFCDVGHITRGNLVALKD